MANINYVKEAKNLINEAAKLEQMPNQMEKYRLQISKQLLALCQTISSDNELAKAVTAAMNQERYEDPVHVNQMKQLLLKCIDLELLVEAGQNLVEEKKEYVLDTRFALRRISNLFQWTITPKARKEQYISLVNEFAQFLQGEYQETLQQLMQQTMQIAGESYAKKVLAFTGAQKTEYCDYLEKFLQKNRINFKDSSLITSLIAKYDSIEANMDFLEQRQKELAEEVVKAVHKYTAKEVKEILKEIAVEELNRDKAGIRIKLLREDGYNSVADILAATPNKLSRIQGISLEQGEVITEIAREFENQARKLVKIRLSADEQTEDATRLLRVLYAYMEERRILKELKISGQRLRSRTTQVGTLKKLAASVKWVFASRKRRTYLHDFYQELTDDTLDDFLLRTEQSKQKLGVAQPTKKELWDDFTSGNIRYFNALEEVIPGCLGNHDLLYGLPEELAKAVKEEPLYLDGLKCQLRLYQEWGTKYILHQQRVLLGDEMGLGKTIQAIAAMVSLKNTGATHFMIICPASVLPNWCKEVAAKSCFDPCRVYGQDRMKAFQMWTEKGGVAVTTYETINLLEMDESFRFEMLIVDEAHYAKNPEARRSQNVNRISAHAQRVLFMTGTALENRVDEMISLISYLRPELVEDLNKMSYLSTAPAFREVVAPVYYRRKREDVLTELPDLIESEEWCTMTAEEEECYEQSVIDEKIHTMRQVSWSLQDPRECSKGKRLLELVKEAEDDGRKVLVFSYYLDVIQQVQSLFGIRSMPIINGSVPAHRRQQIIDEFENAPAGTVLPAQIQAGGTGLNIQSASVVIICEPQIKPSIENQAISRAYRMGQARNVLVYRLLCEESIDEKITEMLKEKQMIFDNFADDSVAAQTTDKVDAGELDMDEKTLNQLMAEEVKRVIAKREGNAENTEGHFEKIEDNFKKKEEHFDTIEDNL